jgi:hypothetical protein
VFAQHIAAQQQNWAFMERETLTFSYYHAMLGATGTRSRFVVLSLGQTEIAAVPILFMEIISAFVRRTRLLVSAGNIVISYARQIGIPSPGSFPQGLKPI